MGDIQQRIALIAERYYRDCQGAFHPGDLAEVLVRELGLSQQWAKAWGRDGHGPWYEQHSPTRAGALMSITGHSGNPPVDYVKLVSRYMTEWQDEQ